MKEEGLSGDRKEEGLSRDRKEEGLSDLVITLQLHSVTSHTHW